MRSDFHSNVDSGDSDHSDDYDYDYDDDAILGRVDGLIAGQLQTLAHCIRWLIKSGHWLACD